MESATAYQQSYAMQDSRNQDTVVTIVNPVVHPPDYVVWSICSFSYLNPCCLGLAALYSSIKARDMKVIGDLQRAKGYGKRALGLNIAALAIIGVISICMVIYVSVAISDYDYYNNNNYHGRRYNY